MTMTFYMNFTAESIYEMLQWDVMFGNVFASSKSLELDNFQIWPLYVHSSLAAVHLPF